MRIKGRRGVTLLLSAALLMTTAACSSSGTNAGEGAKAASGTANETPAIELRMTWWGSQTRHDLTAKMIKRFEEKNPGITIKPEYSGWDGYFDKLSTQVAGSNAPDIIQMDYAFLSDYAKRGTLLDLTPYTQDGTLRTEDHDQSMISAGSIDGKLYAITLGVNAPGVIYNASVLQELGIAEPQESWTWMDFADMANTIADKKAAATTGHRISREPPTSSRYSCASTEPDYSKGISSVSRARFSMNGSSTGRGCATAEALQPQR